MSNLPQYAHEAAETIDASFFSGDTFQDPDKLFEIEQYVNRWLREIESIKENGFFADDPKPLLARYEELKSKYEESTS